ncbi:MAG: CarD family transcriptional regulator [Thermodesulfobacteriota bacterium]|nr:CarD family transcriptional regulator [Thermodesulfobacteriota bacterium]
MYKIGDTVVYPAHGVARIELIEEREISGLRIPFLILKILETQMTVMVPVSNAHNVGIRELIDKAGTKKVMGILAQKDVAVDNQTWNRRYREYMDKIKGGSTYEIAEVLRDLNILKRGKELSFGERKMYDTAKNLLVSEISISKNSDPAEVERRILEAGGRTQTEKKPDE